MNIEKKNEELLRESSAFGDEDNVRSLLDFGVDINSQHSVNGWTALHWAAKRGHTNIANLLLAKGADASLTSVYGESALHLASNDDVRNILSGSSDLPFDHQVKSPLPITPNYLSNPVLAPKIEKEDGRFSESCNLISENDSKRKLEEELVLKVRIADLTDEDFIETEIPLNELTYENVFRICCEELNIEPNNVLKLRKLPNTVVRKDKDVLRFQNFQELELVLKTVNENSAAQSLKKQSQSNQDASRNGNNNGFNSEKSQLNKKSNYSNNGTILY